MSDKPKPEGIQVLDLTDFGDPKTEAEIGERIKHIFSNLNTRVIEMIRAKDIAINHSLAGASVAFKEVLEIVRTQAAATRFTPAEVEHLTKVHMGKKATEPLATFKDYFTFVITEPGVTEKPRATFDLEVHFNWEAGTLDLGLVPGAEDTGLAKIIIDGAEEIKTQKPIIH